MQKRMALFLILLLGYSNTLISDEIADTSIKEESDERFRPSEVNFAVINLKDTKWNGICTAMGNIWFVNPETNTYAINNMQCDYGIEHTLIVGKEDILEIITPEDLGDDGKYSEKGFFGYLFFRRDKSLDYIPCMRNDFDEDKKEELCKQNPYKFY